MSHAAHKPSTFAALSHREFRLFMAGLTISQIGSWMQTVGQNWLVLQLTNSPLLLGLISAAQFTPILLFSIFAGAVADRLPKRTILLLDQALMLVLAAILGILTLTGTVRYWHVLILAIFLGIGSTFDAPIRQAYFVELVGRKDLMNAIALNSSVFNAARIVGPALAGLAMGSWGISSTFFINSASFGAVIASLVMIPPSPPVTPVGLQKPLLNDIAEGLRYIRNTPVVFSALFFLGALSAFTLNLNVLVPVYAKNSLGLGASGYGFLMSAMGAGALTGALSLAYSSHKGPRPWLIFTGAAGVSLCQLGIAWVHSFPLALGFMFFIGLFMITFVASSNTTIQLTVPDELRGRVMGVYSLVLNGVTPVGSLFAGSITGAWGVAAGWASAGLVGLFFTTWMLFMARTKKKTGTSSSR